MVTVCTVPCHEGCQKNHIGSLQLTVDVAGHRLIAMEHCNTCNSYPLNEDMGINLQENDVKLVQKSSNALLFRRSDDANGTNQSSCSHPPL